MTDNYRSTKLHRNQARKRIAEIIQNHSESIRFSQHALTELRNDGLTAVDAWNVLKSGDGKIVDDGELSNGSYRYRLETNFLMVVVAFQADGKGLFVVTAWDKRTKSDKNGETV
jgi:hypothetical protein